MDKLRRDLLTSLALAPTALALGACRPSAPPLSPVDQALQRGAAWLWAQQKPEGSIGSSVYGTMRQGMSLTPYSLLSLLKIPEELRAEPSGGIDRAVQAMLGLLHKSGALGFSDTVVDYPVYATSMMLTCLKKLDHKLPKLAHHWLRGQQLLARRGWKEHAAEGGFPMGALVTSVPPNAPHVDLSMTRIAIESLATIGLPPDHEALQGARIFVERCRAPNSGFVFSPVQLELNKGPRSTPKPEDKGQEGMGEESAETIYEGYGSSTADGLLLLAALGTTSYAPIVSESLALLHRIHRIDSNPLVDEGPVNAFAPAMKGYYRATAAAVFRHYEGPPGWAEQLAKQVIAEQQPDGSWVNASNLQKEDDPVISTALALQALSSCRPR